MQTHHCEIMSTVCEKKFICEICSVKYKNNYELTKHKNRVHGNIKNFECDVCNKKFAEKSKLMHHVKSVHYGLKDYECQIGAIRYFTSQLLKYVKIVHENLKLFDCGVCTLKFNWYYQLSEHTKVAHPGENNLQGAHLAFSV